MSTSERTIAVVDDDPRLLESLANLFESAGYEVLTFSSAKAFLAAGLTGIDCLITDIGMPEMDGFQLREAARKARPELPVIMVTGRHEIADQPGRADVAGVLFLKPIDGQLLLAAVEKAFAD